MGKRTKVVVNPDQGLTEQMIALVHRLPEHLSSDQTRQACDLMNGALTVGPDKDDSTINDAVTDMTRLMHASMHESPRLTLLLAVNAVMQLDVLTRSMGLGNEARLSMLAELYSVASRAAQNQILLAEREGQTAH